jgi:hypothetical protein
MDPRTDVHYVAEKRQVREVKQQLQVVMAVGWSSDVRQEAELLLAGVVKLSNASYATASAMERMSRDSEGMDPEALARAVANHELLFLEAADQLEEYRHAIAE